MVPVFEGELQEDSHFLDDGTLQEIICGALCVCLFERTSGRCHCCLSMLGRYKSL